MVNSFFLAVAVLIETPNASSKQRIMYRFINRLLRAHSSGLEVVIHIVEHLLGEALGVLVFRRQLWVDIISRVQNLFKRLLKEFFIVRTNGIDFSEKYLCIEIGWRC